MIKEKEILENVNKEMDALGQKVGQDKATFEQQIKDLVEIKTKQQNSIEELIKKNKDGEEQVTELRNDNKRLQETISELTKNLDSEKKKAEGMSKLQKDLEAARQEYKILIYNELTRLESKLREILRLVLIPKLMV